jgi:pimeloyl-ACP methyl ester carboxylesterase
MQTRRLTRPHRFRTALLGALALLVALALSPSAASTAAPAVASTVKPTVVLVHGAFADASGFNDVIANLQRRGYPVYAPANPLRGLASDSAYIRSFLATITGPVVLVGHSYGGAVITNAATGDTNVTALVYIAAYALDQGESVGAANDLGGGTTELTKHLVVRAFPGSPYPPHKPRSWQPPNAPPHCPRSPNRPKPQPGGPSPPGTSSPARTTPSRRKPNAPWPPEPTPTPWRSTVPMSP